MNLYFNRNNEILFKCLVITGFIFGRIVIDRHAAAGRFGKLLQALLPQGTGGVFDDDLIDGYIALKMEEVTRFRMATHPVEFDMYYSV